MTRFFSLLAVVLCSILSIEAASSEAIEFESKTYDFATVSDDSVPLTHDFVFTNLSDSPLVVMSASASCGCTHARFSPEPVLPGQSGKITVTFRPAGQRGYVTKNVKVRYKAAGKKVKTVTLKITGNVVPAK